MRALLLLLALLVTSSLGAYVQWQHCDNPSDWQLKWAALRASLAKQHDSTTLMTLTFVEMATPEGCDTVSRLSESAVEVELLGRSTRYSVPVNMTCPTSFPTSPKTFSDGRLQVTLEKNIGSLPPLSTLHLDWHLVDANGRNDVACLSANITPAIPHLMTLLFRFVPLAVSLFILLVGSLRSLFYTPPPPPPASGEEDENGLERSDASRPSRPILPGLSDCLQHLQFVFLTGSLSLRYPGFYQPAAGNLNWFSLFTSSDAFTRGGTYPSVVDGIYEINGTYGGTYGLELMTQFTGAPMTMHVWLTMVVLLILLLVGLAIVIELYFISDRRRIRLREPQDDQQQQLKGYRELTTRVLHIVLSYFLLPVIAISAYQVDYIYILPAYYSAMSLVLIACMLAAFVWLIQQLSFRNLGVLVFDSSHRYRPMPSNEPGRVPFAMVFFVLIFLRGLAIGGLQISGLAQVISLTCCEVVFIVYLAAYQLCPLISTTSICAVSRLVTVASMTTFLPGLASLYTKSVVGYALLLLQATVLVGAILIPNVWRSVELCSTMRWNLRSEARPQVFGLRQLHRRPSSHLQFPPREHSVVYARQSSQSGSSSSGTSSDDQYQQETSRQSTSPSAKGADVTVTESRYYRAPRASRYNFSEASDGRPSHGHAGSAVSTTHLNPSIANRISPNPTPSSSISDELNRESTSSADQSADGNSLEFPASPVTPLGPRWNDFSFRESDLYYVEPQRRVHEWGHADTLDGEASGNSASIGGRWWNRLRGS